MAVLQFSTDAVLERHLQDLQKLGSRRGRQAQVRAVNRTTRTAYTKVVRATSKETSIPQRVVRKETRTLMASAKSAGPIAGQILARGRPLSLKVFGAKQFKYGVRVKLRGENVKLYGMFIYAGTFNSGNFVAGGHVFQRRTSASTPIEKQFGPSVPESVVKGKAKDAFEDTVATVLPRRLRHEIGRLIHTD